MVNLPALPSRKQLLPFLSLGFLILSLGITAVVLQYISQRQELRKKAAGDDYVSVLELSAVGREGSFTIEPGETFQVNLKLIPNQALSAVDVVLDFNNDLLILEDITPNTEGGNFKTFAPLTEAGVFDVESVKTDANANGVIRFGAVTFDYATEELNDPQGLELDPLATLSFRVKDGVAGEAKIEFGEHGFIALGDTTDSNTVKYVEPGSDEVVADILAQPTTAIQATISLGITLPSSLLPESISELATQIPIQVTITRSGAPAPAFDQEIAFTRTDGTFSNSSEISFDGDPGTYTVRVKGPLHLSRSAEVELVAGENPDLNFPSSLLGGDLDTSGFSRNKVDMADIGVLLEHYDSTSPEADINFDGRVDMIDVGFLIKNYDMNGE